MISEGDMCHVLNTVDIKIIKKYVKKSENDDSVQ
jgi:hypothetical protein